MKKLTLALLVGLSSISHASFELMMVLDRGSNRIARFDPTSGANLGSFATGAIAGTNFNLVLNQSSGEVMVGNTGSFNSSAVYDYNSGAYLRDRPFLYGTQLASGNNGIVASLFSTPDYIILSNLAGNYLGFMQSAAGQFAIMGATATNRVYAIDGVTKRLHYWTGALNSGASTGNIPLQSSANFYFTGEMALTSTRMAFSSSTSGANTATLWLGDINGSGVPTLRVVDVSSRYAEAYHCVFGHNDDVYIGARKASGAYYIARYNFVTGQFRGEFATGGTDIAGLTMVVAPEPGSLSALGLGALYLLRRRIRR